MNIDVQIVQLEKQSKKLLGLAYIILHYIIMVITQITRRKNADTSETLRKHSDGSDLPYSGPNLTTMLTGVDKPIFLLQKVGYPFTFRARDETQFTSADFETAWNTLLENPDQPFGKL